MTSYFVRIEATDLDGLRQLRQSSDLDIFRHTARQRGAEGFEVKGLLSEAQIEWLRAAGYRVEVMANADEVARQRCAEIGRIVPPDEPEID